MFENIKEAVKVLSSGREEIKISKIKKLVELYFLQELRKGEHPDDIEFDFMDMCGEIMDYLSTDENMYRVDFKHSTYYKEKEKKGWERMI